MMIMKKKKLKNRIQNDDQEEEKNKFKNACDKLKNL